MIDPRRADHWEVCLSRPHGTPPFICPGRLSQRGRTDDLARPLWHHEDPRQSSDQRRRVPVTGSQPLLAKPAEGEVRSASHILTWVPLDECALPITRWWWIDHLLSSRISSIDNFGSIRPSTGQATREQGMKNPGRALGLGLTETQPTLPRGEIR